MSAALWERIGQRRNFVSAAGGRLEMIRPHAASEPLFADICTEMAERLDDECFHQLALEFALLAEEALLRQPDIPPSRLRRARWMVADFREVLGRER